jgi:hypothetical protein
MNPLLYNEYTVTIKFFKKKMFLDKRKCTNGLIDRGGVSYQPRAWV